LLIAKNINQKTTDAILVPEAPMELLDELSIDTKEQKKGWD